MLLLNSTICLLLCVTIVLGRSNVNIQSKIVGGEDAGAGSFPYIVTLQRFGSHACGASIISNRWILTAAHCVDGASLEEVTFIAGTNQLNQARTNGDLYGVSQIIVHEAYDSLNIHNDVAVVQSNETIVLAVLALDLLGLPIIIGKPVKIIQLENAVTPAGTAVVLAGWGSTKLGGPTPNDLQTINLVTMDLADCQNQQDNIDSTQICTLTKSGEGACHGDSGGPLVSESSNKQIGIVSWGSPCAQGKPDVFTSVAAFSSWILEKTGV